MWKLKEIASILCLGSSLLPLPAGLSMGLAVCCSGEALASKTKLIQATAGAAGSCSPHLLLPRLPALMPKW